MSDSPFIDGNAPKPGGKQSDAARQEWEQTEKPKKLIGMVALVVLIIAQLLFCGGLFRISTPVLAQLPWLFPSYWGYAAAAGAVEVNTNSPLAPQTRGAAIWDATGSNVVLACSAMLLVATVLVTYTMSRLQLQRRR